MNWDYNVFGPYSANMFIEPFLLLCIRCEYFRVKIIFCNPHLIITPEVYFIIKGFRTFFFIFIVISTKFRPICPPAFSRCLSNSRTYTELQTTSFNPSNSLQHHSFVRAELIGSKYCYVILIIEFNSHLFVSGLTVENIVND